MTLIDILFQFQGIEIVLGVQWLELLEPCIINYKQLRMKFNWNDEPIKLCGDQQTSLHSINPHQFHRIIHTNAIGSFFHMYAEMKGDKVNEDISQWPPNIQALWDSYKSIFLEPKELSLNRAIDHRIHLLSGTNTIHIKPYHYLHH